MPGDAKIRHDNVVMWEGGGLDSLAVETEHPSSREEYDYGANLVMAGLWSREVGCSTLDIVGTQVHLG